MNTAKPICVIYISTQLEFGGGKMISWNDCRMIQETNEKEKPDYYWFVVLNDDQEKTIDFKVFYEKDFTEIQYAELKKIIEDAIEKQKPII